MKDPKYSVMPNGAVMVQDVCPECGTKMTKFIGLKDAPKDIAAKAQAIKDKRAAGKTGGARKSRKSKGSRKSRKSRGSKKSKKSRKSRKSKKSRKSRKSRK
jgi:hypothetical protein